MTATQIVVLALTLVTVLTFVLSAGIFFVRHGASRREDPPGLNLVKLIAPLAYLALIYGVITGAVHGPRAWAAAVMLCLALALFGWAVLVNLAAPLTRIYCPDRPVHLVTRGPYRLVRHPCYSAYLLCFAAGLVAGAQWWLAAVLALQLGLFLHAARFEERKFAASPLAADYARYRRRTGMLLPNPFKRGGR